MVLKRRVMLQVTAPALLVALTMLATSLLGIRSINHLQAGRDKIVSEHVKRLDAAQDLETYLRFMRFHSLVYIMDMSPERWGKLEKDQNDFEATLALLRSSAGTAEEQEIIRAIEAGYVQYRTELEASARKPPGPDRTTYLAWSDAHPIRHVVAPCGHLLDINRRAMQETADDSSRDGDRSRVGMILLGVMGAAGGLIGGFGVAWGLNRSITRLSVSLQDVHAHLDREVASVRVSTEGRDLPGMEKQVERLLASVRGVVDQLQQQEREALRAEQLAAVGQLAAGLAHEVRNPLTSIKLLVGAAMHQRSGRGLTDTDLQVIHDEAGRLERKIEALLDFARPRDADPRPGNVSEIVHQVTDLVKARGAGQSVSLNLDLPNEPVTANLDADQFKGVILNLFLNALDAMPGGGTLDVRLRRDGPLQGLRLTVTDSGPGVDPAVADRLFTPFVSTKPTGTGLGLSVSRRIVNAHGGTLTAANRPGGGACFEVTLPAASLAPTGVP
ncbi:ATP-binding protein [Fimbriiglobus ruber]|uniref:histidine kinase n=1 Tax=Fimbriiglobus ruber TaxID=1908690 RepID=A0A225E4V8_9BACT|nr:ATP-binding protein [Fimbriiglobus ruber]OWK43447.1 Two-component sensor PilS [Fimbriiglobus ruber]